MGGECGREGGGQDGVEWGGKWDNCNSIINKYIKKNICKPKKKKKKKRFNLQNFPLHTSYSGLFYKSKCTLIHTCYKLFPTFSIVNTVKLSENLQEYYGEYPCPLASIHQLLTFYHNCFLFFFFLNSEPFELVADITDPPDISAYCL